MIELDDRLTAARAHAWDWARDLRSTALELDRDPDTVYRCLDNPAVRHLSTMLIPAPWLPDRTLIGGYRFDGMTAMERVVFAEEIAAGDAGMMLASPAPRRPGCSSTCSPTGTRRSGSTAGCWPRRRGPSSR
ncbi:hypothetical protein V2I01_12125 [Micromonospora sp. BRA006-A]|nr:hypothetical protein [Micromonospora sp. BRA006-A]